MTKSSFMVAFEGSNIEGEMDVADLAPFLLTMSDVLRRANEVVNDQHAEARVMVRANERGSFLVQLVLDVSMVDQVLSLLDSVKDNSERVVAANQLLDLVIKGGTILGGIAGFLGVVKWLRGRRPDTVVKNKDGTTTLEIGGEKLITTAHVIKMLEDMPLREHVARLGNHVENLDGVDEVSLGDDKDRKAWSIKRDEATALRLPPPEDEVPEIVISERTVWLELVTAHFHGDYKWRFRDGELTFTAEVVDEGFLTKVHNGEVSLSAADKLFCEIEEEQEITSQGIRKLATKITKVIDYRPGAKQMRLL